MIQAQLLVYNMKHINDKVTIILLLMYLLETIIIYNYQKFNIYSSLMNKQEYYI